MLRFLIKFHQYLKLIKCCGLLLIGIILSAQALPNQAFIDNLSQKGTQQRLYKKYNEAIKTHQKVLQLRQEAFGLSSIPVANSLTNLGHCFYDKIEWDSAIIYYEKALVIEENIKTLPPEQPFQMGDTYRCLADSWIQKGDFLKAQNYIPIALNRLQTESGERLAAAWNTQGQCFSYLGDIEAAIDAFKQAIQILPQSNMNAWVFYTNLGDAYAKKHDNKALFYFDKALKLMPSATSSIGKAQLFNKLGEAYFIKNEWDSALHFYQKAAFLASSQTPNLWATCQINLAKIQREKRHIQSALSDLETCLKVLKGHKQYPLETLMALTEYAKTLFDKAYQNPQTENWTTTLKAYEDAIQFGEQYENQLNQAPSALILRGYFYERYGGAAEVCTHLGLYEKALLYSEQSKAYLLKQKHKISGTNASTILKDIRLNLENPKSVLLEYCFGRQNLILFQLSHQDFKVKILPIKGLQDSVLSIYSAISTPFYSHSDHHFAEASVFLYQQLIQPAKLSHSVPLIIIPDGILHYLPFDILLKSQPTMAHLWQNYKPLYLISEHSISYKITALLPNIYKGKAEKELLSFAPTFEQNQKNLQPLRFNKIEVETLKQFWDSQILIGTEASKSRFIQESPQYRILHLSTHGIANDIYPDQSFLAFSFKNETDSGILTVAEINNLDLKSELVSLSACQTASGTFYGGEGLMSIAHAFLTAGSHSVLASLWDVNEGVTKDLMALFYENLKNGMTKDEALRQAKLSIMTDAKDPITAHPYFWSAFTTIGDMSPLEKSTHFMLWLSIGLGVLLFFSGYLLKFQDKFNSKSLGRGMAKLLRRKPV